MVSPGLRAEVETLLQTHLADEIMLDGFCQWSANPTSMSAGHALEENYLRISDNLIRRYTLTANYANEIVEQLKKECTQLTTSQHIIDSKYFIYEVRDVIRIVLAGDIGSRLRENVTQRLMESSPVAQCMVALFNWMVDQGLEHGQISLILNSRSEILKAILGATLGNLHETPVGTLQDTIDELISCGVINRLFYQSTRGNTRDEYCFGPMLPVLTLGTDIPSGEALDVVEYIESLVENGMLEQARVVEETALGSVSGIPGLRERQKSSASELSEDVIPSAGLFGIARGYQEGLGQVEIIAVNPLLRQRLIDTLTSIKGQRVSETLLTVSKSLTTIREDGFPAIELINFRDRPDCKIWRLDQIGESRLWIYIGNWVVDEDLRRISQLGGENGDSFLFILVDQTLPSFSRSIANTPEKWTASSISVMYPTARYQVDLLQGEEHKTISRIKELTQGEVPIPKPTLPSITVPTPNPPSIIVPTPTPPSIIDEKQVKLLECFTTGDALKAPDPSWFENLELELRAILEDFGIDCIIDNSDFEIGPRLIRADLKLGPGVRIKRVMSLSKDIANRLFSNSQLFAFSPTDPVPTNVVIESVPAKGMIGIQVPRDDFEPVRIRHLLSQLLDRNPIDTDFLSFVMGMSVTGQAQFSTLSDMPHLLVAGAPGSGKSVFLNAMIVSLVIQNDPQALELVLIDPKRGLEFGPYERLPHVYGGKILPDSDAAFEVLTSCEREMFERYEMMKDAGKQGIPVRHIRGYNSLQGYNPLPYRVIIIDEFADLVNSPKGGEITTLTQSIAQLGRAAGFHIVLCTQRPEVKFIPGMIKSVIPSRLAFKMPASIDSTTILDERGAEDLLGKGDMYLKAPSSNNTLCRLQGAFLEDEEIQCFVSKAEQIWKYTP